MRLGENSVRDPKDCPPVEYVRVTTLNAGAGLEAPIVFLVGMRLLFEQEQSVRISDEERENLIRENTRKIYMAFTRAGQRLVITYVGKLPESLRLLFSTTCVNLKMLRWKSSAPSAACRSGSLKRSRLLPTNPAAA